MTICCEVMKMDPIVQDFEGKQELSNYIMKVPKSL
jgi:hypothetical protein